MNHFLKIALDHPAKAERILLWLLQSLIVIWMLSTIFNIQVGSCFYADSNSYIGEECLKKVTSIEIATYIVLFAVTYILTWLIFADLVVKLIFRILGWFGNLLFNIVLYTLIFPFYLFLLIKSWLKKTDRPSKFWSSKEKEKSTNDFVKNQKEFNSNLEFFYYMNRVTKTTIWTEFLLNILSYEKVDFIQSRIIRYFTILVIVICANTDFFKLNELSWYKTTIIVAVILLGLIIFKFNDIYSKFSNSQIHELIPKLENDLYQEFVFKTISSSRLMYYFEIEKKKRSIILSLKSSVDEISMFDKYVRLIEFYPFNHNQIDIATILKHKKQQTNGMTILVSQITPSVSEQKLMNNSGVSFIYAESEEDILDALRSLQPYFSGILQLSKKPE